VATLEVASYFKILYLLTTNVVLVAISL
jgi:hypothetical protein